METLQLSIDFETERTATNAQAIAADLRDVGAAAHEADARITAAEQSLRELANAAQLAAPPIGDVSSQLGSARDAARDADRSFSDAASSAGALGNAAGTAAPQIGQVGTQAGGAAGQINNYTTNVVNATTQTANFSQQSVTNINNVSGATGGLMLGVQRWLGVYVGMNTVIKLYETLTDRIKAAIDAQKELAGERLGNDQKLEELIANLNLGSRGAGGQNIARRLRDDILKAVPASPEQAIDALEIANSTGQDPQTGKGMEVAQQIAWLMAREQVSKDTAMNMVRLMQSRGINTADGFKAEVAKADAQFVVSDSTDRNAFLKGLTNSVLPEVPKGADPDYASAMYAALLRSKDSEQQAASAAVQAWTLAQGTNKKGREFMAHEAARRGVTNVAPVTDDEARASIMADDNSPAKKEAERLARIAEEEKLAYVKGLHRGKALSPSQATRQAAALNDFDDEAAVRELSSVNAAAADHLQSLVNERKAMAAGIRDKIAKAKTQLTSQRESEAYLRVPIQERMERVVIPTFAARRRRRCGTALRKASAECSVGQITR